jgi:hypothetical protein
LDKTAKETYIYLQKAMERFLELLTLRSQLILQATKLLFTYFRICHKKNPP